MRRSPAIRSPACAWRWWPGLARTDVAERREAVHEGFSAAALHAAQQPHPTRSACTGWYGHPLVADVTLRRRARWHGCAARFRLGFVHPVGGPVWLRFEAAAPADFAAAWQRLRRRPWRGRRDAGMPDLGVSHTGHQPGRRVAVPVAALTGRGCPGRLRATR